MLSFQDATKRPSYTWLPYPQVYKQKQITIDNDWEDTLVSY